MCKLTFWIGAMAFLVFTVPGHAGTVCEISTGNFSSKIVKRIQLESDQASDKEIVSVAPDLYLRFVTVPSNSGTRYFYAEPTKWSGKPWHDIQVGYKIAKKAVLNTKPQPFVSLNDDSVPGKHAQAITVPEGTTFLLTPQDGLHVICGSSDQDVLDMEDLISSPDKKYSNWTHFDLEYKIMDGPQITNPGGCWLVSQRKSSWAVDYFEYKRSVDDKDRVHFAYEAIGMSGVPGLTGLGTVYDSYSQADVIIRHSVPFQIQNRGKTVVCN